MGQEITVYGTDWCHDTRRTRSHLEKNNIRYNFINIDEDRSAEEQVVDWGSGKRKIPVVEIGKSEPKQRLTEPSNEELDRALRESNVA